MDAIRNKIVTGSPAAAAAGCDLSCGLFLSACFTFVFVSLKLTLTNRFSRTVMKSLIMQNSQDGWELQNYWVDSDRRMSAKRASIKVIRLYL